MAADALAEFSLAACLSSPKGHVELRTRHLVLGRVIERGDGHIATLASFGVIAVVPHNEARNVIIIGIHPRHPNRLAHPEDLHNQIRERRTAPGRLNGFGHRAEGDSRAATSLRGPSRHLSKKSSSDEVDTEVRRDNTRLAEFPVGEVRVIKMSRVRSTPQVRSSPSALQHLCASPTASQSAPSVADSATPLLKDSAWGAIRAYRPSPEWAPAASGDHVSAVQDGGVSRSVLLIECGDGARSDGE